MNTALLKDKRDWLFTLLFVALAVYYNIPNRFNLPPQSNDIWRQSDCWSFALNQYQDGINPFQPRLHNQLGHDGHAVGEFPILYSFIAFLFKIFGVQFYPFRITVFLIFYFGMLALFRLSLRWTQDTLISLCVPVIVMSTPLMVFYSNNFLCDVPSLSLSFIAWFHFFRYYDTARVKYFWYAMLFFTLAGWLKANSMFSLLALGFLFAFELAGYTQLKKANKVFLHPGTNFIGFTLASGLILAWYQYAVYFNKMHSTAFLGTSAWPGWPLWEASQDDLLSSIQVFLFNLHNLFHPLHAFIFIIATLYLLFSFNKINVLNRGVFLLLLLAQFAFICWFFVGFRNNFYYLIGLLILPVFTILFSWHSLINRFLFLKNSIWPSLIVLLTTVYLTANCKAIVETDFFNGGFRFSTLSPGFYDKSLPDELIKRGITPDKKVISLPDYTPNGSLGIMNRNGWSKYNFPGENIKASVVEELIDKGASFLILSDSTLLHNQELLPYLQNRLPDACGLYFFKLNSRSKKYRVKIKSQNQNLYLNLKAGTNSLSLSDQNNALTFIMLFENDSVVSVKGVDAGLFACTEMFEEYRISLSRNTPGAWEKFIYYNTGNNTFCLKGSNGKYIGWNKEKGIYCACFDKPQPECILQKASAN